MEKIVTQIYELQDLEQANTMVEVGVDRVGSVIVSQKDWMVPEIREIGLLLKKTEVRHSVIPLFCDEDTVFRVIDYYAPHIIHFCESLVSPNGVTTSLSVAISLQEHVKKKYPFVEIMRSIPIPPQGYGTIPTFEIARAFEETSDYFLTDTWLGKQPVDGFIGITGLPCNWETAERLVKASSIPVILAGGMSPENVYDGILKVRPSGVDSCTRTNRVDENGGPIRFKKDVDRVRIFVREVRRAQHTLADECRATNKRDEP